MTDKRKKVNKSVSLNAEVYDRLLVICERLGVNVNAYLVSAVGQQIQRDEAPLLMQDKAVERMMDLLSSQLETQEFLDASIEVGKSVGAEAIKKLNP